MRCIPLSFLCNAVTAEKDEDVAGADVGVAPGDDLLAVAEQHEQLDILGENKIPYELAPLPAQT